MTDIVELCYKRKLMVDTIAQKKNIRILFSSDMNSYLTGVDHMKIEKIIDNLLSNAIKYSLPENIIEVSIMTSKKEWCFVIKDYGTGISEKNQKRLFKEFYREESNLNANIVGSGIGLILVKNYVSMHDGELYLESKENKGTTFKIHIGIAHV